MDQDGEDQSNKINYKEKIEEHQTSIDNLELNFEKIQKESSTLKTLQTECLNYVEECKKEIQSGLLWRDKFLGYIKTYVIFINVIAAVSIGSSVYYKYETNYLLYSIMIHNSFILLTPLVSLFKSYGERNKNDYYPPAIKVALEVASSVLKKGGH